jgi:hypothetical protein
MTEDEERVVKALAKRMENSVREINKLAEAFKITGNSETARVLEGLSGTIEFNTKDYLLKELGIN